MEAFAAFKYQCQTGIFQMQSFMCKLKFIFGARRKCEYCYWKNSNLMFLNSFLN